MYTNHDKDHSLNITRWRKKTQQNVRYNVCSTAFDEHNNKRAITQVTTIIKSLSFIHNFVKSRVKLNEFQATVTSVKTI